MTKVTIQLPHWVMERELPPLLRSLQRGDGASLVALDMKWVGFWCPAALVAVISCVQRWNGLGQRVVLLNHENNQAFRYLQRIDFFAELGVDLPESFRRHEAEGRFIPIQRISLGQGEVNAIANEIAGCLVPGGDWYDDSYRLVQYAAGEVIANAKQHSLGTAWVSAQYFQKRDLLRIGIADNGRGLLASFRDNASPHYHSSITEVEMLRLAMQPGISSATHLRTVYGRPSNRGIGLSMLSQLVAQTCGYLYVASGTAALFQDGSASPRFWSVDDGAWPGTLISAAFQRAQILRYGEIHSEALRRLGLLDADASDMFGP